MVAPTFRHGAPGLASMHGTDRWHAWSSLATDLAHSDRAVDRLAARQGFLVRRVQICHTGVTDAEVRRNLRRGVWFVPRRGFLCVVSRSLVAEVTACGAVPGVDRSGVHTEVDVAAAALARRFSSASHESGALMHCLPVLRPPGRVQLTVRSVSHGGGWPDCVVHATPLDDSDITTWFGVPVTSVARTVIDVARRSGRSAGLVAADAALGGGLVTRAELARELGRARRRPGAVTAKAVVETARVGAESPLESLTRLCLLDADIEEPLLQARVSTDRGTYWVDMLLERQQVVIEADGRTKYRSDDVLWREKLRQDAVERAGFRVVRVTWDDVTRRPGQVVSRIRAACAAGRPTAF